jgi:type I restriction enzyme S subunit
MKNKVPKDWQEMELGDVLDYEQPGKYIIQGEILETKDEDTIPVLTANKSFILGYTQETEGIYDKLPVIIFDDFTTDNKYVDFKFKVKSSAMKLLRPKIEHINLRFIFLVMQGIKINSTTHKRYYLSVYQKIKVPIPFKDGKPNLKEQERIVKILEKAEKLKQKREQADDLTKDYLQSLFYNMFGDPENNKKGFEVVPLGKYAKFQGGFAFKSNDFIEEGIKLVKITNVHYNEIVWEDIDYLPEDYFERYKEFALNDGDIVMSMTRPIIKSLNSVKIVKINEKDLPCLLNQRVGRFIINKNYVNETYLLHFCYSPYFKREVDKYCSTSLQPNISSTQVEDIKIPLPPLPLQQKFAKIVEKVEKLKEKQKQSKEKIDEMYSSIMQKAFKGELI